MVPGPDEPSTCRIAAAVRKSWAVGRGRAVGVGATRVALTCVTGVGARALEPPLKLVACSLFSSANWNAAAKLMIQRMIMIPCDDPFPMYAVFRRRRCDEQDDGSKKKGTKRSVSVSVGVLRRYQTKMQPQTWEMSSRWSCSTVVQYLTEV